MSAGALRAALRKLDSLLRAVKYPGDVDYGGYVGLQPAAWSTYTQVGFEVR